jgi:hypothetical protein
LEFVQSTQGLLVDRDTLEVYQPAHPYMEARADADGVQLIFSEDGVTERRFDSIEFDLDLDGDIDGANTAYTARDADGRAVRLTEAVVSLAGVVKFSTLDFVIEDDTGGITMLTAPISATTVDGKRDFRVLIGRRAIRAWVELPGA